MADGAWIGLAVSRRSGPADRLITMITASRFTATAAIPSQSSWAYPIVPIWQLTVRDKTEAAHQRGDMMDKLGKLMGEWAAF